jgi:hypothetical protein
MNAYKIRWSLTYRRYLIVTPDGSIVLKGLPFSVGKSVEVIVLDDVSSQEVASSKLDVDDRWKSLQGSVTRYDDPFESVPRSR